MKYKLLRVFLINILMLCLFSNLGLAQTKDYRLDRNYYKAFFGTLGSGIRLTDIEAYKAWVTTQRVNFEEGQATVFPLNADFLWLKKNFMYGLNISVENRLNRQSRIPFRGLGIGGKIGYNLFGINRVNLYTAVGFSYNAWQVDWAEAPPFRFQRTEVSNYNAMSKQEILMVYPEIGLNFIIPFNNAEGFVIGLRGGIDMTVLNGQWKYSDYKDRAKPNRSRFVLATPEMPNIATQSIFALLSFGYYFSW
ncbi:MAG: hypothetical protein MUE81_10885 [Thermoflexibacter sp.]|jgi:hypothetical protein|nr:hypothetical protein [Thermoflexibacter sp.]